MSGRHADGSPLREGDVPDDLYFIHNIFRLHGIPPHEIEHWDSGWKRVAFVSIGLQMELEHKRINAGIGRLI